MNDYKRFLRIVDFTQDTDDHRYVKNEGFRYILEVNDIVMVRYGASAGFVGTGKTGVLANNLFKIHYFYLSKNYMILFFNSLYFDKILENNARGVAMPAISFGFLNLLVFPLPPLAEQKQIVEKVDELLALCDRLEEEIEKAESKRGEILEGMVRV